MADSEGSVSEHLVLERDPLWKRAKGPKNPKSKTNPLAGPGEIQFALNLDDLALIRAQYSILKEFYLELLDADAHVHSLPLIVFFLAD